MNISNYIDYTLLDPDATKQDIENLCFDAKKNNFYSICINSAHVNLAKQLLNKTNVKICTVIGYPLGNSLSASKAYEAKKAIHDGADEIDMVINVGFLKSKNYSAVLDDINEVKHAINNKPLKVAIEISELNKNEVIKACEICLEAKVDFIKTSSGFSKNGATYTAVKMIKKTIKGKAKIKVCGIINNLETISRYIEVGANRIGASSDLKRIKSIAV